MRDRAQGGHRLKLRKQKARQHPVHIPIPGTVGTARCPAKSPGEGMISLPEPLPTPGRKVPARGRGPRGTQDRQHDDLKDRTRPAGPGANSLAKSSPGRSAATTGSPGPPPAPEKQCARLVSALHSLGEEWVPPRPASLVATWTGRGHPGPPGRAPSGQLASHAARFGPPFAPKSRGPSSTPTAGARQHSPRTCPAAPRPRGRAPGRVRLRRPGHSPDGGPRARSGGALRGPRPRPGRAAPAPLPRTSCLDRRRPAPATGASASRRSAVRNVEASPPRTPPLPGPLRAAHNAQDLRGSAPTRAPEIPPPTSGPASPL